MLRKIMAGNNELITQIEGGITTLEESVRALHQETAALKQLMAQLKNQPATQVVQKPQEIIISKSDKRSMNKNVKAIKETGFKPKYKIGDVGPAGGIVFKVSKDGLKGKECAPAGWSGVKKDPQYNWDAAEQICKELNLNGFSDWYLPSKDELNNMYKKLHYDVGVGGFDNVGYWSSSKFKSNCARFQSFFQGIWHIEYKSSVRRVRPVRAF